jgi:hypothetical protein
LGLGAAEGAEIGGAIGTTIGGITAAVLAIGTILEQVQFVKRLFYIYD